MPCKIAPWTIMKIAVVFLTLLLFESTALADRHPVVLIPGLGGSQIEGRWNHTVNHFYCRKTTEWTLLWLNLEYLAYEWINCFIDNFKLQYDPVKRRTYNADGVEIRIPGFGNTTATEWLGTFHYLSSERYFYDIVATLVAVGYERGTSVRSAPYDFRRSALEQDEYFVKLKALVEETYDINGRKPVVFIAHSMGTMNLLYFLNQQSAEWKDLYVKSAIMLAGPWGGAVKSVKLMVTGDSLGDFMSSDLQIRNMQRSMTSSTWLMPNPRLWGEDLLVTVNGYRNYTAKDYKELFDDMKYETGYKMWADTRHLAAKMAPPGVEVHCLHGAGLPTVAQLNFADQKSFPDGSPTFSFDDGDGTVNLRSAVVCQSWISQQKQPAFYEVFDGVEHTQILSNPRALTYILHVLGFNSTSFSAVAQLIVTENNIDNNNSLDTL